jgi:hypothetical protein
MIPEHWLYYVSIEQDLLATSRYVEFSEVNRNVYSIEFARILLAASSEVDVVAKELCRVFNPDAHPERINEYREIILGQYPLFQYTQLDVPRYNLKLAPWVDWKEGKTPEWWSDHNEVKHERHTSFHKATLANALKSTAGLLAMLLHLYRKTIGHKVELQPLPQLFIPERFIVDTTMFQEPTACLWNIPSDFDDRFTDLTTLDIQEESWSTHS